MFWSSSVLAHVSVLTPRCGWVMVRCMARAPLGSIHPWMDIRAVSTFYFLWLALCEYLCTSICSSVFSFGGSLFTFNCRAAMYFGGWQRTAGSCFGSGVSPQWAPECHAHLHRHGHVFVLFWGLPSLFFCKSPSGCKREVAWPRSSCITQGSGSCPTFCSHEKLLAGAGLSVNEHSVKGKGLGFST